MILLNPGPVTLSERVRKALLGPDLCHREVEFAQLQQRIKEGLLRLYELNPQSWAAVLLTGSGTAAVEAMITTLVPDTGRLLVIENGAYGERISQIATIYGINHLVFSHPWDKEIDVQQLEKILDDNEDISHIAIVHHETTTGRLNDLQRIASVCQGRNIELLLDAVSSFGAERIDFDAWNVTGCAATANKCLHSVPGASFVIARRYALGLNSKPRNLYLNLTNYCQQQDRGGTPFTQSVQTFYALAEALRELTEQGGWQQRQRHYGELIERVRNGLAALGIRPLLADGVSSMVLHAFHLPTGISYETLHDQLKQNGFVIYAGQGALACSIFRISTMGAIEHSDIDRFLSLVEGII
ncbi:MAG: 2-aminoethylphosphonate aminotransferase [Pseudomonadota bacterium]